MDILSFVFVGFVVLVMAGYYLLPFRLQNAWLLLASLVFALSFGLPVFAVLVAVSLVNYLLGLGIGKNCKNKALLILGLFINIGLLIFFRILASAYGAGLVRALSSLNALKGSSWLEVLLPIGFSFYVLQAVEYLIACHQGRIKPIRSLIDFSLYLAFFPKFISGPIEKPGAFLKQVQAPRRVTEQHWREGFTLIVIGLLRKAVIADTLRRFMPANAFQALDVSSTPELWGWLLMFALILYNDFAGYSNIVQGIGCFLGFNISTNFKRPFLAASVTDFWSRWHVTFSTWLRDNLFFPLSRALRKRISSESNLLNITFPVLITMLASGFWHGASLGFLLWGLIHGFYQAVGRFLFLHRAEAAKPVTKWIAVPGVFFLTLIAWVPFATRDLTRAIAYWKAMFTLSMYSERNFPLILLILLGALSFVMDFGQEKGQVDTFILAQPKRWQVAALTLALLLFFVTFLFTPMSGAPDLTQFIYQGF